MKKTIILLLTIFIASCSSNGVKNRKETSRDDAIANVISKNENTTVRVFSTKNRVVKKHNFSNKKNTKNRSVPVYSKLSFSRGSLQNKTVKSWINYYTTRGRDRFQRVLNRGEEFREVVQNILLENGLPEDLYYLAFVESGFVVKAKSHASAKGVWQFMKGTGKQYGLHVDNYLDERNDPIRSTEAASKYLRKLYSAYNSWELALSAYNAGEYRVLSAIMKGESRDYWNLSTKKLIPKETRNYVPKIIASRHLAKNWRRYGFSKPKSENASYPDLELLQVPSPISLSTLAKKLGLSKRILKKYNPHLKKDITSPRFSTYEIWIPKKYFLMAKSSLHLLKPERIRYVASRSSRKDRRNYYIVKKGDSLGRISNKFNMSINHLKGLNRLSSNRINIGQKLRVTQKSYYSTSSKNVYRVRPGDTLSKISAKFNIRMSNLRKYNNLDDHKIFVGQYLNLKETDYYKVKRGDSLASISKKYGKSIAEIKRKNKLRTSRIYPGQMLKI